MSFPINALACMLALSSANVLSADGPLALGEAGQGAVARPHQVSAQNAAITSPQEISVNARQTAHLNLTVGADNLSINGLDRLNPNRDVRVVPKVDVMLAPDGNNGRSELVDFLVRQVLQRNPGIDAMRAAVAAANARIETAGALDDPMVSYLVAPNTTSDPQGPSQNVQISQKFPWPGTLELRRKAAEAETASADEKLDDLRLRLAALTRANYADWYYTHRALEINAENKMLVTRLRTVAEAAYAAGQSPQQDVLQAEVELTRLRNQTLVLKRLRHTVQTKINALQNLDPGAELPVPADLPAGLPLPQYAKLREVALVANPMLRSLDARVSGSRNRVDLAHKGSYPNVALVAGYNSLMNPRDKRLTLGITFNIPFGGNHSGEVNEAQARLREADAKLADARAQLLGDLDQAYTTAAQYLETIQLYTKQLLPLAKLNLQAAEDAYSSGGGDFLKLITAEQQYLTAKLDLARARADFFTQWASLDFQTGGALSAPSIIPLGSVHKDTKP